ncbi:MAG: hypothetical protein IPG93_16385 [Burkholderiales bacterium]|nr:hypothetical protein [Burkholderiales bacterium]
MSTSHDEATGTSPGSVSENAALAQKTRLNGHSLLASSSNKPKRWARRGAYMAAALGATGISLAVTATVTGDVFRDPPPVDESHLTPFSTTIIANDALKLQLPTNEGSFENSSGQGSHFDTRVDSRRFPWRSKLATTSRPEASPARSNSMARKPHRSASIC